MSELLIYGSFFDESSDISIWANRLVSKIVPDGYGTHCALENETISQEEIMKALTITLTIAALFVSVSTGALANPALGTSVSYKRCETFDGRTTCEWVETLNAQPAPKKAWAKKTAAELMNEVNDRLEASKALKRLLARAAHPAAPPGQTVAQR